MIQNILYFKKEIKLANYVNPFTEPDYCWCVDKNSKESFIKKLQLCMKHFDYKDDTKDVKGKVSLFFHFKRLQILINSMIISRLIV